MTLKKNKKKIKVIKKRKTSNGFSKFASFTTGSITKAFSQYKKKQEIKIHLNARNFSYWDVKDKDWKIRPGSYSIEIGSSSEKIELSETITLGN